MEVMEERITLPLTHEDRQYLRERRSEVTLENAGPKQKRGLQDTHEAWVAEVEAAMDAYEHVASSSKSVSVMSRLDALSAS